MQTFIAIAGVVIILVLVLIGNNIKNKEIEEKKKNGTYKKKDPRSVFKMNPEKFEKLNALDLDQKDEENK